MWQTQGLSGIVTGKQIKLSKFEWDKKNIVIVPVVAAILAGTFTSVRYVINLTDTIEANKQVLINLQRDLEVAKEKLTDTATRLSAAEATWEMAENLYRQLADQVSHLRPTTCCWLSSFVPVLYSCCLISE